MLVRGWELSFHHDGVLRPGLQRQDEVTRLKLLFVPLCGSTWRIHISDHPAVGAAGVLPVKLSYVLKRSVVEGKTITVYKSKILLYVGLNCIPVEEGYWVSVWRITAIYHRVYLAGQWRKRAKHHWRRRDSKWCRFRRNLFHNIFLILVLCSHLKKIQTKDNKQIICLN